LFQEEVVMGKGIDHVVVDVEIQRTIEELPGGWDDSDKMGVSVAVVYEYLTDRFRLYGPQDVEELQKRLLRADRISGYNIWAFDFPVIWGLPGRKLTPELAVILEPKTDDLLRRIWSALKLPLDRFSAAHKGWKLDDVSKGTLNIGGKIADGAQAPRWYQSGEWGKLCNYCVDDVTIERDMTTFVDKFGYVFNAGTGRKVVIPPWKPVVSKVEAAKDEPEFDIAP
jgi:DEAD/DEAH box helicase domain-containing protein